MSVSTVLHCLALIAFLFGAYKHFIVKEPGRCAMTYMYQLPEYIPIQLSRKVRAMFPSYNLYGYGEGHYARGLLNGNYEGIPVLFLPGNSGSYKQVRSLASVSLTKANENKSPFHFNYFAADFNEELSALYGNFLMKETEFVSICIRTILNLYKNRSNHPKSVILVGHSMGGIIARALFTLPHFDSTTVHVILTQATPHLEPVFSSDVGMQEFYTRVNDYWSQHRNSSSLRHVNVVSISGGPLDLMVRPDLTVLGSETTSSNDVSLMSNAVPGVWVGMDHLCIVWCNQLVLATVRTIFKLIDPNTKQLIAEATKRRDIIDWNLVRGHHKALTLKMPDNWAVPLAYEDLWTSRRSRHWEYDGKEEASALLLTTTVGKDLVVTALHLNLAQWIFGCTPDDGQALCYVSTVPSCESFYLPSDDGGTSKAVYCRSVKESRLVIKLQTNPSRTTEVFAETFDVSEFSFEVSWPRLFADHKLPAITGSSFAILKFPSLSETWQTYTLEVHTSGPNCKRGIVQQYVPWANEDTFTALGDGVTTHSVVLYSQRPSSFDKKPIEVRFFLDTKCLYDITVSHSVLDTLQQAIRFHVHLIPALVCASTFGALSSQMNDIGLKRFDSRNTVAPGLWPPARNLLIVYATTTVLRWGLRATNFDPTVEFKQFDRLWSLPVLYFFYVVCTAIVNVCFGFIRVCLIPMRRLFSAFPRESK